MPNDIARLDADMDPINTMDASPLSGAPETVADTADKPTRSQAQDAIRTLLAYVGEDPSREGLADTPSRVVKAYDEWCEGYGIDADGLLSKTFGEVEGYQGMVLLKDIPFASRCEHHLAPIIGRAHVAYLPQGRVVGISKLARVVEAYAKRLQIQERMTQQIVGSLTRALAPRGVAVMIEAEHHCMTTRGVHTHGTVMTTQRLTGAFSDDADLRADFFRAVKR